MNINEIVEAATKAIKKATPEEKKAMREEMIADLRCPKRELLVMPCSPKVN